MTDYELISNDVNNLYQYAELNLNAGNDSRSLYNAQTLIIKLAEDIFDIIQPVVISNESAFKLPFVYLEHRAGGIGLRRVRQQSNGDIEISKFGAEPIYTSAESFDQNFRCWNNRPDEDTRQKWSWDLVSTQN